MEQNFGCKENFRHHGCSRFHNCYIRIRLEYNRESTFCYVSDLKQLEVNLSAIRIHIQKLETLEEFKVTAIRIRGILTKRSFHFESDCIKLYRLLEPSNNQQLLKDEERIEAYNLLIRYSKCWVERRNRQWSEEFL